MPYLLLEALNNNNDFMNRGIKNDPCMAERGLHISIPAYLHPWNTFVEVLSLLDQRQ